MTERPTGGVTAETLVVRLEGDAEPLKKTADDAQNRLQELAETGRSALKEGLTGFATGFGGAFNEALAEAKDLTGAMAGLGEEIFDSLYRHSQDAVKALNDGLVSLLETGRFSFDELRKVAVSALKAIQESLISTFSKGLVDGLLGGIPNFFGLGGLQGRARGGPVSPYQPYLVGETGPELFVPKTGGTVVPAGGAQGGALRPVNIAITVQGVREENDLNRSAAQMAVAVRRAIARADRDL